MTCPQIRSGCASQRRARSTYRYRAASYIDRGSQNVANHLENARRLLQELETHSGDYKEIRGRLCDILTASTSQVIATAFASAGGIGVIACIAATAAEDFAIQLYALRILSVLAVQHSDPKSSDKSAAAGRLSPSAATIAASVIAAASRRFTNVELQKAACEAFASLAECGNEAADVALKAGAGEATAGILHMDQCGESASGLLKAALRTSRAFAQAGCTPAEGVGELVAVIRRHAEEPRLQVSACQALQAQLTSGGTKQALAAGAFEALLAAAQEHPDHLELQTAACTLLGELTEAACESSNSQRFADTLSGNDSSEILRAVRATPVAASRALAIMLRAFIRFRSSPQSYSMHTAFARISALMPAEAVVAVTTKQPGNVCPELWVGALQISRGNAKVQQMLCESVGRLSREGFCPKLVAADAAEAVLEAMKNDSSNPGLHRAACEALAAFAWCDSTRIVEAGGIKVTLETLRLFEAFAWVCLPALEVLIVLFVKCREAKQASSSRLDESTSLCWDLVARAMRTHQGSRRIVSASLRLLQLLSGGDEAAQALAKPIPGWSED